MSAQSAAAVPASGLALAAGTIEARGLSRRFGSVLALTPIDLTVGPGGITGLLGPNGSGKSTLLRVLVGLVPPSSGAASIDGVALAGDGTAVRARCAYAPGEIALYREMRARDLLDWLLRGREPEARTRARAIAAELELPLRQRVRAYSHGMKRQLMFAAALAPRVRVRILDEPTEGLDPSKRGELLELLRADARGGTTVLLSSHHLGEVDRVCERLVFLSRGRLIGDERAEHLRARAASTVRWSFPAGSDPAALAAALKRLGAADVRAHARGGAGEPLQISATPADGDPRAFTARALASSELGAPSSVGYGALSLADLYRELYGVEGL